MKTGDDGCWMFSALFSTSILILHPMNDKEYGQRDFANILKRFLIDQFVEFFLLIGPSNASKYL